MVRRACSLILLWIVLVGGTTLAQSPDAPIFYLLEQGGIRQLFRTSTTALIPQAVSALDQGSVLAYDMDSEGAAYITRPIEGGLRLFVVSLAGAPLTSMPLPSVVSVNDVKLTDTEILAAVRNSSDKPTVMVFDRTALSLIAERAAAFEDTSFTLHDAGNWVLAYNPNGAMDVFSVPDLASADFALPDVGFSEPVWSPTGEQLQFIASMNSAPDSRFINLIDFGNGGASTQFPLNGVDDNLCLWSEYGRFIVTSGAAQQYTLTEIATSSQTVFTEPGFLISPLAWSADDRYLLYTAQLARAAPALFAYDTATGEKFALSNPGISPVAVQWSPDEARLAIIGVGAANAVVIYSVTAPAFDVWQPLISTTDSGITGAALHWVNDEIVLEYNSALLAISAARATFMQLTPATYPVVPGSVRVLSR